MISIPVLRPLICSDKLEIIALSRKIGTYETSILPFEDCCTIFDPKNPVTKPKEDKCLHYESLFDYQPLVDACIANERIVKVSYRKEDKEDESIF